MFPLSRPSCPSMPNHLLTHSERPCYPVSAGDCPFPTRFQEYTANSDQHPSRYPYRSRLSPTALIGVVSGSPRPQQRAMPWAWKMRAKSKRITLGRGADHFPKPGQNQPTANRLQNQPSGHLQKSNPKGAIPIVKSILSILCIDVKDKMRAREAASPATRGRVSDTRSIPRKPA